MNFLVRYFLSSLLLATILLQVACQQDDSENSELAQSTNPNKPQIENDDRLRRICNIGETGLALYENPRSDSTQLKTLYEDDMIEIASWYAKKDSKSGKMMMYVKRFGIAGWVFKSEGSSSTICKATYLVREICGNQKVNFRAEPSLNGRIYHVLGKGHKIRYYNDVHRTSDGHHWDYITFNGKQGFITRQKGIVCMPTAERQAQSSAGFIWPTPAKQIRSDCSAQGYFGACRGRNCVRSHAGLDINTQSAVTRIKAVKSGTVMSTVAGGYGKIVFVEHGQALQTRYAHLYSMRASGGRVSQGSQVGVAGNTGNAMRTCPGYQDHLHFEVRRNGIAVDPMQYLPR